MTKQLTNLKMMLTLLILSSAAFFNKTNAQSCRADFMYEINGTNVQFSDSSYMKYAGNYTWSFGDGTSGTGAYNAHVYPRPGSYNACLIIRDTVNQCMDTVCKTINIANCKAAFGLQRNNNSVDFTNYSSNQSAHFSWNFGDGSTSTQTNPTHVYTASGTYYITLKMTDSANQCTDSVKHFVMINASPTYYISGSVTTDNISKDMGIVYLIFYNAHDSTLSAIDSTNFKTNDTTGGHYTFTNVKPGMYMVKAALNSGSTNYSNYLPTYADSALKWIDAKEIMVTNKNEWAYIYMRKGSNTSGKGFIGGKVSQGANKAEGDPLENIQVMLFDSKLQPLKYTYTDAGGSFNFTNLALGRYQVYTEVPGLMTTPSWIELTEANPGTDEMEIKISSRSIVTLINEETAARTESNISIYPNPVQDQLNISVDAAVKTGAKIMIYDYTGKQVITQSISHAASPQIININTSQLSAGIYLMQLQLSNETIRQFKFVK